MRIRGVALLAATIVTLAGSPATAQGRFLHVRSTDGVRLAVWTTGSATARAAVILVAGGPGDSHGYFGPMPAALARDGLLVAAYDARGVAATNAPSDGRYTLAAQVGDIDAIRRALGARRVALIGHSFGGLLASDYAALHASDLFALALADPLSADLQIAIAGYNRRNQRVVQLQQEGLIPTPVPPDTPRSCTAGARATLPAYLGDPHGHAPPWVLATTCSTPAQDGTFPDTVRPATLAPIVHGLGRLTLPALDLFGSRDLFGTSWDLEDARLMTRAHPRIVEIAGGGHIPWIEHPRQVFATLGGFITKAEGTRCGSRGALCRAHLR